MQKIEWTPERVEQLRTLYPDNTAQTVGEIMGLRTRQIYNKVTKIGLTKSLAFWESDKSVRAVRG